MRRENGVEGQSCRRCGQTAVIQGRNEPLCLDCFLNYVQTKVVKRMEQFRVRNSQPGKRRTLLLPLSFGISSLSLLNILDTHLQTQLDRTGRTGFDLHVLHIQSPGADAAQQSNILNAIRQRLPRHSYSTVPLLHQDVSNARDTTSRLAHETETRSTLLNESENRENPYTQFLSSIPSVTARTDILNILLIRAVVSFGQTMGCEGIVWGDSTTRLAQKILAETAKGRGFSLPAQITDGISPWGVAFFFPMRDLLKKEIVSFCELVGNPLTKVIDDGGDSEELAPAASRNGSVDLLMRQYFESAEDQYPSIVANVVRIAAKLEDTETNGALQCRLCKMMYLPETASGTQRENTYDITSDSHKVQLCYGCRSAVPKECYQYLPD